MGETIPSWEGVLMHEKRRETATTQEKTGPLWVEKSVPRGGGGRVPVVIYRVGLSSKRNAFGAGGKYSTEKKNPSDDLGRGFFCWGGGEI